MAGTARILLGLACALTMGGAAAAGVPAPGHPLIGTWQLALPGNKCVETYEYRADGTGHSISAAEETDSTYIVSATPNERGFYVFTETITKGNGKPDCSGNLTALGSQVTLYLAPLRGGLLLCFDITLQRCLGPMTRIAARPAAPQS